MRIINKEILDNAKKKYADCRKQIDNWIYEVKNADWKIPKNITDMYSSADVVCKCVIINIKGNHYRLVFIVNYKLGIVLIEWLGTHKEYDKIDWKKRCCGG